MTDMAKAPASAQTRETEQVTAWVNQTLAVINEISTYAASGTSDPDMDAMIRRFKPITAALMAALQTIR